LISKLITPLIYNFLLLKLIVNETYSYKDLT